MSKDLISRQAAIDAFMTATADGDKAEWCKWVINQLPSAQPEPCEDAVSREAISEWLKQYGQDVLHGKYKFSLMYIWKNLMDLPSAQPEQRWIPCSERLPEGEKKHYWICTDTGYQCECRWTNINHFWTDLTTDWHWHIMDIPQYSAVVAWMPLPEPWKEGEADG